MRAALERYHGQGLYAIERSSAAAMDRLATAAQQLPDADDPVRGFLEKEFLGDPPRIPLLVDSYFRGCFRVESKLSKKICKIHLLLFSNTSLTQRAGECEGDSSCWPVLL